MKLEVSHMKRSYAKVMYRSNFCNIDYYLIGTKREKVIKYNKDSLKIKSGYQ